MNNNSKVVLGALGAAFAGAAAGVLLAPKKGTDTRKLINTKATDLATNAKSTLEKGYQKSKSSLTDLADKVKTSFQTATNKSTTPGNENMLGTRPEPFSANKSTNPAGGNFSSPEQATLASSPSPSGPGKKFNGTE